MADVFISYNKSDREDAIAVSAALAAEGFSVWWDDKLKPLNSWDSELQNEINKAKAVVVLWSPRSVVSDWVRTEASVAKDKKKLLPIKIEDCEVPLGFHLIQHVSITDWNHLSENPHWGKLVSWIIDLLNAEPRSLATEHRDDADNFSESIRQAFAQANKTVERLTQDQKKTLDTFIGLRRARIAGSAGSGKTLVACERAIRSARASLSTIFLCHSPFLADYAKRLIGPFPIAVFSFSEWVHELTHPDEPALDQQWSNLEEPSDHLLGEAFDQLAARRPYDVVIIDEGQDFRETWWWIVEAALSDSASAQLYIFHDDHQALLPYRSEYPVEQPVLTLSKNCRNAGRVFETVRCFHPQAPEIDAALKGAGNVSIVRGRGDPVQALNLALPKAHDNTFIYGDVAVLLAGGAENTQLSNPVLVHTGDCEDRWQDVVIEFFARVFGDLNQWGITGTSRRRGAIQSSLAALSDELLPNADDIELVRACASDISLNDQLIKENLTRVPGKTFLEWRVVNSRLQFQRWLGGIMHAYEVVHFFQQRSWANGLPIQKTWQLVDSSEIRAKDTHWETYSIGAFKGLEADTVLLLIADHRPLSEAEYYVALSRAKLSLLVVDCSSESILTNRLRKVETEWLDVRQTSMTEQRALIDRYLNNDGCLMKLPSDKRIRLAALRVLAANFTPGEILGVQEFDQELQALHSFDEAALLRICLVDEGLFACSPDNKNYWRTGR